MQIPIHHTHRLPLHHIGKRKREDTPAERRKPPPRRTRTHACCGYNGPAFWRTPRRVETRSKFKVTKRRRVINRSWEDCPNAAIRMGTLTSLRLVQGRAVFGRWDTARRWRTAPAVAHPSRDRSKTLCRECRCPPHFPTFEGDSPQPFVFRYVLCLCRISTTFPTSTEGQPRFTASQPHRRADPRSNRYSCRPDPTAYPRSIILSIQPFRHSDCSAPAQRFLSPVQHSIVVNCRARHVRADVGPHPIMRRT